jgi:hypothetical protein
MIECMVASVLTWVLGYVTGSWERRHQDTRVSPEEES